MRSMVRALGTTVATGAVALVLGCAGVPNTPEQVPRRGGLRGEPLLVITHLSPPVGSIVDSTTVIRAGVRYYVPDTLAHPGPYSVDISFMTSLRSSLRPATPEERESGPKVEELVADSGYVELSYPVSLIWSRGLQPLRVSFTLLDLSPGPGSVIDATPRVRLRRVGDVLARSVIEYRVAHLEPPGPTPSVARIAENRAPLPAGIGETLDSLRRRYGVPGVIAAWSTPDGGPETVAVGVADPDRGDPLPGNGRMLAGSIGKSFVAATVLALAGEGKLELDDPLEKWLGDRPWFARLPNGESITLRHLLTHSAGIPDHVYDPDFQSTWAALRQEPGSPFQPEDLVGFVLGEPPLFPAGEGWAYTDTGYVLLGLVVEDVVQGDLFLEIGRRFLDPLDLDRTDPSDEPRLADLLPGWVDPQNPFGLPRSTLSDDGTLAWDPAVEWAGGGLVSHPEDLVRWGIALFTGQAMATPYLAELESGVPVDGPGGTLLYGAGVSIRRSGPFGPVLGHAGYIPGYLSSLRYYPRSGVAVALQLNTDGPFEGGAEAGEVLAALEAALARHLVEAGGS